VLDRESVLVGLWGTLLDIMAPPVPFRPASPRVELRACRHALTVPNAKI
jgi:hypothetical protein